MADDKKKIRKEEEAIPTEKLPEDLIECILSWIPVKSLLRFRCVSKPWYSIITNPAIVKIHLSQSLATNSNQSLFFKKSRCSNYLYSLDLDASEQQAAVELDHPCKPSWYGTQILGSCNGLLCISNTEKNIHLCNPSTRRHWKLPTAPTEVPVRFCYGRFIVYGFGYDPITDDYKLVRIVQYYLRQDNSWHSEVKVYALSTNSWRKIGDLPFPLNQHHFGVFANSALHWVPKSDTGHALPAPFSFIVSFDLKEEQYREVPLPDFVPDFVDGKYCMNVRVLEGKLCICNFSRVAIEVWLIKDYGVRDSWEKQFSIDQPSVIRSPFVDFRPICYSKNDEIVLQMHWKKLTLKNPKVLVLYDPRTGSDLVLNDTQGLVLFDPFTGSIRNLRIPVFAGSIEIENCVGSLVPLNVKGNRGSGIITYFKRVDIESGM